MAETNTRQASRTPVTLKIKFKSETLEQFIERYSVDISHGGIFIRTKDPLAVGTALKFEFQLKDATPLIAGEGTVVWTREHDPKRSGVSPGMGVRFDKLPSDSQKVLDQVLAKKEGSAEEVEEEEDDIGEGFGDDFVDTPTRVAPAALVDSLTSGSEYDEGDMTPLPKPMPFHGDMDDFSDEAFSESTKVASLDSILAQAKSAESDQDDSDYDDQVFASTSAPPPAAPAQAPVEEPNASADNYEDPFADLNDDDDDASDRAQTIALENDDDTGGDTDEDAPAPSNLEPAAAAAAAAEPEPVAKLSTRTGAATGAPSKAAVAIAAAETERSGSSMPWIAVAAVIILIGGVGGFWLLNKDKDKVGDKKAEAAAVPAVQIDATSVDENGIKDPVKDPPQIEEPAVPTVSVAISTMPAGATLSIEGTDITATSPASLDLPEGKTSVIVVTHSEFLSQSIEVVADGTDVGPITLVAMPRMLRFTSTPPGAKVFVNGQKLPGVTPLDFPFNSRISRRAKMSVQYRLPRYKLWAANLATQEGFVAVDKLLVRTIDGSLEEQLAKRPAIKPRPPKDPSTDTTPVEPKSGDDPPKDDPPKDDPPKDDPPKDDPPKDDPPKDDPPKADPTGDGEPTPDWMK